MDYQPVSPETRQDSEYGYHQTKTLTGSFRTSEHVVFDDNFSNAKFFTNNFTEKTNNSINTADLNNRWLKECKLSFHQCVLDFNKSISDESIFENNNNIFNDNQQINTTESSHQSINNNTTTSKPTHFNSSINDEPTYGSNNNISNENQQINATTTKKHLFLPTFQ